MTFQYKEAMVSGSGFQFQFSILDAIFSQKQKQNCKF